MAQWFIIDEERQCIVTGISTDSPERAFEIMGRMERAEHLSLVLRPPKVLLDRYYRENPELGW